LLARLVRGGDPAHWNHDVVEQTLTSIAAVPENRRRQDLITSFFTLNNAEGEDGQETVAAAIRAGARLLKKDGRMVITLSARRGFEDRALDQIKDFGFEVEDGIGFNRLTDEHRNQLFKRGEDQTDEDAVFVESEIRRRRFYVLILKKTSDLSDEAIAALPTNNIMISRFPEEVPGAEETPVRPDDITVQSTAEREKKLKEIKPNQLERSDLQPKSESLRESPYTRRQADKDRFRDHRRKLELISKYRHLLLGPATRINDNQTLQRIRLLLDRTYGENAGKAKFKPSSGNKNPPSPLDFWKTPRDAWVMDPESTQSITFKGNRGKPVITVFYSSKAGGKGEVTGIAFHETNGGGKIVYTENRKLLRPGFEFNIAEMQGKTADEATLLQWLVLEQKKIGAAPQAGIQPLYSDEIDYTERRRLYDHIDQVFATLLENYLAFASIPEDAHHPGFDFEALFTDPVAQSVQEFHDKEFPTGDYIFPYAEQRAFVPYLFNKWREGREAITLEEMEKYFVLRQMIRDLRGIFQMLGPTFYKQKTRRSPTVGGGGAADQEEARRHRRTLGGNTSYLSAHAVAAMVIEILRSRGGKAKHLDQAAGTGALADALSQQGSPKPDGKNYLLAEMDTDPNMLAQQRPAGFRPEDGVVHLLGDVTRLREEFAKLKFTEAPFDIITALFIIDMLRAEDRKRLFIEANMSMTVGGEYILTVPQSWDLDDAEAFQQAMYDLGFDVDTPVRGQHKAKPEFLDRIVREVKDSTNDEGYAKDISREVGDRLAKQFTILRFVKRKDIDPESAAVRNIPAAAFELKKTETGVRGPSTGTKPFEYDPQAMRRWLEILRWLLNEWTANDIEVFNADAASMVTREQIIGEGGLFPEIATENALEHLYQYRFLFSSTAETGNHHELITVVHQFWNLGARRFHRKQIELLRELYRRGPPARGPAPSQFSANWAAQHLASRAKALERLASGKPVAGAHLQNPA
ncbi:MAG TPA: class I SAM-dependent methyltransferase, partial [Verrucomicrobiae bacterium]|nr:class I SAM-dependent methyltransferase [Verrucomicrobiae bacterium]